MQLEVEVPDGQVGVWRVTSFTLTKEDAAWENLRNFRSPALHIVPGTYKRLTRGNTVVMSNTPMEVRTNLPFIREARGRCLINGLGLGMVLTAILKKPEVEHVTVVEKEAAVLELCGPTFSSRPNVTLIHADALEWRPAKGETFDVAWHDIWDEICGDNLPQMATLKRSYARRVGWQGAWAQELCRR